MTQSILNKALQEWASTEPESATDVFAPQFVNIGDYAIRYVRQEKAGAPKLVLLNGLPQSIRMWEQAWDSLSSQFDVLAFDIPGFGLSKGREAEMSPRQLSAVVVQVMDHFGIDKAHLVGPDVGVPITLATAINYPERLESINIFDGPGHYPPAMAPILKAVIKYRFVRWMANGINKKPVMKTNFVTAVKDGYHHYRPSSRAIKEYYEIAYNEQAHRCAIAFFGTYPEELAWIQQRLKDIRIPALITWGKQDPFVLASNADYLAAQIPSNKLVVFDNASHFSSEDAGQEYLDVITSWVLADHKQA